MVKIFDDNKNVSIDLTSCMTLCMETQSRGDMSTSTKSYGLIVAYMTRNQEARLQFLTALRLSISECCLSCMKLLAKLRDLSYSIA